MTPAPQRDRERVDPATDVLDLGTGSGAVAAVDISRLAVFITRVNALLARQRVRVRRGDLTRTVRGVSYDLVVSNPPYVPSPAARRSWTASARRRPVCCVRAASCHGACGPVLRSRRPWLVRQGPAGVEDSREELVVVRAERSPGMPTWLPTAG